MMGLMDGRRALMSAKKESKWYLNLQPNTIVQAVIDEHDIFLSFFPSQGSNRQIQIVFKKEITLQAGDTLGVRYSQIGNVRPQRYCDLSFWSKTPSGSYSTRSIKQNFGLREQLNNILTYTATETIIGSIMVLQARNGDQTYSTPLHLHFEVFINGNSVP